MKLSSAIVLLLGGAILVSCAAEKPVAKSRNEQDPDELLSAWVGNGKFVDKVEMRKVDLIPGMKVQEQMSPIPVAGYVVAGKVLFQVEGDKQLLLSPGDAYYKPPKTKIQHFDAVEGPAQCVESYLLGNKDKSLSSGQ